MTKRNILGSVISGTMRNEDLFPAFTDLLDSLKEDMIAQWSTTQATFEQTEDCKRRAARIDDLLARIERGQSDPDSYYGSDECFEDSEELASMLNEFAPEYCYFGSHPGDGSDYGFWLCEDFRQMAEDDGVLIVNDTSEVADDYCGLVLHINDHGNATLYRSECGALSEIWSVV